MLCEKYERLLPIERVVLIGKLLHAMQSDSEFFDKSVRIIRAAKKRGLFDNIKILPNLEQSENQKDGLHT